MFQSRTSLGSARNRAKSKSSEAGTFSALIYSTRAGNGLKSLGTIPSSSSSQQTIERRRTQCLICSTCSHQHQLPNLLMQTCICVLQSSICSLIKVSSHRCHCAAGTSRCRAIDVNLSFTVFCQVLLDNSSRYSLGKGPA